MNKKFAVIFDMDGVMVNNNQFHKKAWRAFVEKHNFNLSEEQLRKDVYGKTNRDILTHLFGESITDEDIGTYADEKKEIYRSLYSNVIHATKGLIHFLDILADNKVTVAVATSAPPKNVKFVLSAIGAEKYFHTIVDDTLVQKGKPDPEIYLTTAKRIHFNPEKCIVVEDSLSGIESALRAKMHVIAITTTHTAEELSHAHLVVDDFTQLNLNTLETLTSEESN